MTKKYLLSLSIDAKNNYPVTTEIELSPRLKGSLWSEHSLRNAVIKAIPKLEEVLERSLQELRLKYLNVQVFQQEEGELTKAVTYKYELKNPNGVSVLKIRTTLTEQSLAEIENHAALELSYDITDTFVNRLTEDIEEEF